jgi:hypothetical protein
VRWAGYVARLVRKIIAHIVLDGISEGEKSFEKLKHTGKDNIKMDI